MSFPVLPQRARVVVIGGGVIGCSGDEMNGAKARDEHQAWLDRINK